MAEVDRAATGRTPAAVAPPPQAVPAPSIITTADLMAALRAGYADFLACRSDVIFLCIIYPVVGGVLWAGATGSNVIHLVFPLIAGFALVAPVLATGLYEISRQREAGQPVNWVTAFDVFRTPAIGGILALGLVLLGVFIVWLLTAELIHDATLGPVAPASLAAFARVVALTGRGQLMAVLTIATGAVFALGVLSIAAISFPLMLDRHVGVVTAVSTSVRAVNANKGVMLQWGVIVTAGLVLGSLPLLVGLAIVLPILGHATWHLHRALIRDEPMRAGG